MPLPRRPLFNDDQGRSFSGSVHILTIQLEVGIVMVCKTFGSGRLVGCDERVGIRLVQPQKKLRASAVVFITIRLKKVPFYGFIVFDVKNDIRLFVRLKQPYRIRGIP